MPVDLVSAAVGAAFGQALSRLIDAVKDVTGKAVTFKSNLERLQSTLISITPLMEEIEEFNIKLDRRKDETNMLILQMIEGETLVRKCSKIWRWNCFAKIKYGSKIEELEQSIRSFIQVNILAQTARDLKETLVGVNDIRQNLNLVPMNGGWSCTAPKPQPGIVGLDVPLMELFKDDVSVLVLAAPAGCGKTTLVKMLGHVLEIKGKFVDRIFFVTVSKKPPSLKVIVQRLFDDIGGKAVEFRSDEDAINQLEQRLTKIEPEPILLILDDVWSESLLEKFEFPIPNYKILVTTRFAFPRFQYTFNLKLLNYNEATELFRHASKLLQDENPLIPDDLVNKIVKSCGRLPLALEVIGKSLCGKPVEVWRTTEKKWSNDHSILDFDEGLLRCLESSLDILDDVIKKCFMDLGSFPEDQRIPAAALIDMWVELYELDEDGVIAKIYELNKCNLASLVLTRKVLSEADSHYNEDFVSQHDLLRELAIRQSNHEPIERREKLIVDISENNFPEWWMGQNEQSISGHLLSIANWFNLLKWWSEQI